MQKVNWMPSDAICPRCGKDNQCAVAHQQASHTCWCMRIKLSKNDLAYLKQKTQTNSPCFCQTCLVEVLNASTKEADKCET